MCSYRGFDPVLDREVAIKLMLTDFTEDTEQMRPRFYREARAAAKLNHRNIVTIFEFAEESNVPYIVMEFLRGTPLGARINGQPPLSIDDKLNIVAQLCDGLSYAHEQGVVHRDVKPDNVFILEDGSVKLLDFGIAKLHDVQPHAPGRRAGQRVVHVARAGGRQRFGRRPRRRLLDRRDALRAADRPQAVRGDAPTAVILKILKDDPTPIDTYVQGTAPAAGRGRDEGARKEARRPLALGRCARPRAAAHSQVAAGGDIDRRTRRNAIRQHADDEGPPRGPAETARQGRRGTAAAVGQAAADARDAATPKAAAAAGSFPH